MYPELSLKIMDTAFERAKQLAKALFRKCESHNAWEASDSIQFAECTEEIGLSNLRIHSSMSDIEVFVANNLNSSMKIQNQLGQIMEDVNLNPSLSDGLDIALIFFKKGASFFTNDESCSQIADCRKTVREVLVQLKMIEWGFYGLGESSAGMFLAYHYFTLGPYFGNFYDHNWPHIPFQNPPTTIETMFNQKMKEITFAMSNGILRNASILDLPAYGSRIAQLEKHQKNEPNWPTEINFSILENNQGNLPSVITNYKMLLDHWDRYMQHLLESSPKANFTTEMENNRFLNFTSHIREDMETFLIAIEGSFLSPYRNSSKIWSQTAQKIFKHTKDDDYVNDKGLFDKLLLQCAFKRNLLKKKHSQSDLDGGCELFHPTLTSNGFCYTFNGQMPSELFTSSDMLAAFKKVFSTEHSKEFFQGAGIAEGKFIKT
jgi:hypothetical protein